MEMRLDRRLFRTWLFILIALLFMVFTFANYAFSYSTFSSASASASTYSPLMAPFGIYPVGFQFLVFGLIFLAFEVRSRDKRERLLEVMDTLPVSNFELVFGRTLGISILFSIPLGIAIVLIYLGTLLIELTAPNLGFAAPEFTLTLATLGLDLLPNFVLFTAILVLVTMLVRYRVLVALIGIGLFTLLGWIQNNAPVYMITILNTYAVGAALPSELAPDAVSGFVLSQRVCMLLAAFACLFWAAYLHPRPDAQYRQRDLLVSIVLTGLFAVSLTGIYFSAASIGSTRAHWNVVHHQDLPTQIELESLRGSVVVDPSSDIDIDLELEFVVAPTYQPGDPLIFSLNPAYDIEALTLNGDDAEFSFADGVLSLLPKVQPNPDRSQTLGLSATGDPDPLFAFLDSVVDVWTSDVFGIVGLFFLGNQAAINQSGYVALTPATAWYPLPGYHTGRDLKHITPRDFFTLALDVEVPEDWFVAGTGHAELASEAEVRRFHFDPVNPVHEVALYASDFERRTLNLSDIEFEILTAPEHTRNLDAFESVLPELEAKLQSIVDRSEEYGITYPYETFTIVEAPTNLRTYGGGWRMHSIQSNPGIHVLREGTFLEAFFESKLVDIEEDENMDEEEKAEQRLAHLTNYFENDITGGDVLAAAGDNLTHFQADVTGVGAIPFSYIIEFLGKELVMEHQGFYSIHTSLSATDAFATAPTAMTLVQTGNEESLSDYYYQNTINRPHVWDALFATPPGEVKYEDAANAESNLHALFLRGRSAGRLILDWLGSEQTAEWLQTILTRYRGKTYTVEDALIVADELNLPVRALLGDWLHRTTIAGFQVSPVTIVRLPDRDYSVPVYESSFVIENAESAPGLFSVEYISGDIQSEEDSDWLKTQPFKLEGNRAATIALKAEEPIHEIRINPYFSLNRKVFSLDVRRQRNYPTVDRPEMPLIQHIPTNVLANAEVEQESEVIVDDLDEGFSVDHTESVDVPFVLDLIRFALPPERKDAGLGVYGFQNTMSWSRQEVDSAYGKYRRTVARVGGSATSARVHFQATLPEPGLWQLQYHFPGRDGFSSGVSLFGANIQLNTGRGDTWGTFDFSLKADDKTTPIKFDASEAGSGWVTIGQYDIENEDVTLSVSSLTDKGAVVADAIRWTRVN